MRAALPGFVGFYEVDTDGVVYRVAKGKGGEVGPLKPHRAHNGYLYVYPSIHDSRRHLAVHDAVVAAFIGPKWPGLEVNHKNGIKTDNRIANLEYVTHKGNLEHAVAAGLMQNGERRWNARLTANDVSEIRWLATRMQQKDIAARYGVSRATISDIVCGRTWKHVGAAA